MQILRNGLIIWSGPPFVNLSYGYFGINLVARAISSNRDGYVCGGGWTVLG